MKLLGVEKWVEEIDKMIDRLAPLDCERCLPDFLDRMLLNKVIREYVIEVDRVTYVIDGQQYEKSI